MKILVTGGAGFIGSNLVEALLEDERISFVRVLDNLSTGFLHNIEAFFENKKFEFMQGDIRDFDVCLKACNGIDFISHQAALGSVPRSIKTPLNTNDVNVTGTLNIFYASIQQKVKRVVFAASSSTYGDSNNLPKVETIIGKPLSPYAVTKYVNELYAEVFSKTYSFEYIGLRYFNIFGSKQSPTGAYAAVIPLFMSAALEDRVPMINGDGSYSRDFTFVANAVHANCIALFSENKHATNQIYNIATGERTTLNQLWGYIKEISGSKKKAIHGPNRKGDIPHSLADISKAKKLLNYSPIFNVEEGLRETFHWYKKNLVKRNVS